MRYAFGPLIKEKKAITYIDDTLLQPYTKEMFNKIKEYHALLRKANLKAAPDKTMSFLRKVKFLYDTLYRKIHFLQLYRVSTLKI